MIVSLSQLYCMYYTPLFNTEVLSSTVTVVASFFYVRYRVYIVYKVYGKRLPSQLLLASSPPSLLDIRVCGAIRKSSKL